MTAPADDGKKASRRSRRDATRRCPVCGTKYPLDYVVCPKDSSHLERPEAGDDPLIGEVLGGSFCITALLAEGAMGRVYEAEHTRLPRRFAIKVMREELRRFPEALARVEREAQAIARVSSDNVVQVIDLIRLEDGRPCLVTELLEGDELGELLAKKDKLSVADSISIARQVCRGLVAAHAVGVLHRDLKPANLFLARRRDGSKPVAKILDFGVAKMSDGSQLTLTGMVLGSPAYMAPEQARGDKDVDARADVYSLGAVLYHMLTGAPPFVADDPAVLLTRVMDEDPPPLRSHDPSIPGPIERLVMRTLSRKRDVRPATVADLELELAMVDPEEIDRAVEVTRDAAPLPARPSVIERPSTALPRDTVTDSPERSVESSVPAPGSSSRGAVAALALVFGLLIAAAVADAAPIVIRFAHAQTKTKDLELVSWIAGAIGGGGAFLGALRALVSAWARPASVRRVGSALGAASLALVGAVGVAALAKADARLWGVALDSRMSDQAEVAVVGSAIGIATLLLFVWKPRARSRDAVP